MVDPNFFNFINMAWGPHTVDCFAASHNSQVARFHSRFWCPGAEAVDTFTVNWEDEMCWLVPPVYLVGRALRHAEVCKTRGTLVVPMWKSAFFWPLLCPDGVHLAPFIHAWFLQPVYDGLFQPGHNGSNLSDSLADDSFLLVVYLDFVQPPRLYNCGFCLAVSGYCPVCSP